ncbi:hypothetical protein TPHA_0J01520 [Tetrapisispora phaffii CBS 4417]|uniref:Peptidase M48 domain-containing protein n=1 Tax=Tetrapisispora phaffii (strain ATCC 24235 / CBS 4417 / NBRC 1672 / NRRL Y-8282 / UCD 70-5) TaxID=1071381 RepID=G8BYN1_TETPH|nr:hypothetical protein TPHA_0J01520 [Tetrapisispora phaffii CBS 4417]CCE64973.1 hypothetical protein TPHA_0J01520 [Tetrapisispora phaffii CBS 4417]
MFSCLLRNKVTIARPLRTTLNNQGRYNPSVLRISQGSYSRSYSRNYRYERFNNADQRGLTLSNIIYDKNKRKYVYYAVGGFAVFYFINLKKAPISGRMQFIWLPEWLELKIGKYSYNSIINQYQQHILPPNNKLTRKVENIFYKVLDASIKDPEIDNSKINSVKWEVHIIDTPNASPNAFVLPGGKVFVFTSILPICKNDDGLATVLSHEFAHQLARHTSENLSKAPIYFLIGLLMYSVTGINSVNDILLDGLLRMPASRKMETEADYIGLMLMSRACFNPEEAVNLWARFSEFERRHRLKSNEITEFLSTHPASERRIENMQKWLPKARIVYENSDCAMTNNFYQGFTQSVFGNPSSGPFLRDNKFM